MQNCIPGRALGEAPRHSQLGVNAMGTRARSFILEVLMPAAVPGRTPF